MARKSAGTAILGLGIGGLAFFFLSKQPGVQSLISTGGQWINAQLGGLSAAAQQAATTAGAPPPNVTSAPIVLGGVTIPGQPVNIPVYTGPGSTGG